MVDYELGAGEDEALDTDWREGAEETDADYEIASSDYEGCVFDRLASCATGLCEHLMAQLHGAGGAAGRAAGAIVHELEETGWLLTPLKDIAEGLDLTVKDVEAGLKLVQGLDPAGVRARNLAESLGLQAKEADR